MIKRLLSIFLILTLTSLFLCVPASASIVDGIENIPGDGQYMADAYIENYEFDCEELGALDGVEAIGLVIGNMLFSLCRIGTTLFLYIFRLALQLNIAEFMLFPSCAAHTDVCKDDTKNHVPEKHQQTRQLVRERGLHNAVHGLQHL